MSRRFRAIGERGGPGHFGFSDSSDSGFDNSVLGHIHSLLDEWEEEIVIQQSIGRCARVRRRNYWHVRNVLAQILLHTQNYSKDNSP